MACPLSAEQINSLRLLVESCKCDPAILGTDELGFFKSFIESLGGEISSPKEKEEKENKEPKNSDIDPEVEESESAESDVELDYEGVIEPDNDPPQVMGSSEKEVSEEDKDKSNKKRKEAVDFYAEGKYEDAIKLYTEAILLNPRSAILYAKRGQCFIQMKKPNACIRDCSKALEINPDNATGYKYRGRAHRLLGNFVKAAEDLRMACKIDFDEQTDDWLKEVTPNARKLEEHRRKYERKKFEKELKETRKRIDNLKREQKKRAQNDSEDNSRVIDIDDIVFLLNDPELRASLKHPLMQAVFADLTSDQKVPLSIPANSPILQIAEDYLARNKGQGVVRLSKSARYMLYFLCGLMNSRLVTEAKDDDPE